MRTAGETIGGLARAPFARWNGQRALAHRTRDKILAPILVDLVSGHGPTATAAYVRLARFQNGLGDRPTPATRKVIARARAQWQGRATMTQAGKAFQADATAVLAGLHADRADVAGQYARRASDLYLDAASELVADPSGARLDDVVAWIERAHEVSREFDTSPDRPRMHRLVDRALLIHAVATRDVDSLRARLRTVKARLDFFDRSHPHLTTPARW